MENRFLLQETENGYCCTDLQYMIVCRFENQKFNTTQKVTMLEDNNLSAMRIATALREMADWLMINHREKLYKVKKETARKIG